MCVCISYTKHEKIGNYFCFQRVSEGLLVLMYKREAKKMWNLIDLHGSDLQKLKQNTTKRSDSQEADFFLYYINLFP